MLGTARPERWGAAAKKREALIPLEEKTRAPCSPVNLREGPSQAGRSVKDTKLFFNHSDFIGEKGYEIGTR
jgi:hypothetical protein